MRRKSDAERGGKAASGRGSAEAIEKRRAARLFNEALLGRGARADGRTERRRRRLFRELAERSRGGRALKPIDVLARVHELIELGEPLASIRKVCPPPKPVDPSPELLDGLRRIHGAYGFAVEAYRFVGIDERALRKAGVLRGGAARAPGIASARPRAQAAARRGAA